jgi:hypothetical protein
LDPLSMKGEHVFGVGHVFASFNDTFIISVVFDKIILHGLHYASMQAASLRLEMASICSMLLI